MNAYEPFPSEFLPDLGCCGERMDTYYLEIKAKTNSKSLVLKTARQLWDSLIPNNYAVVAKASPAKSRIIPNAQRKSKKAKGEQIMA